MRVLAVIPARCGSKRVPHKNLAEVGGVPLYERAFDVGVELFCPLYLSTDCVELVGQLTGWLDYLHEEWTIHERRCGADGPMGAVLLDVLARQELRPEQPDAVVCLQPTSPFRTSVDVESCIDLLAMTPSARSVVSVNEETGRRNGAVYVTRVDMLRDGLVFDEHSLKYPMPADRSLDINTPADLEEARRIARERGW